MVEVTQADRDAAFAVLVHTDDNNGYGREYIRDGLDDGNMVVQAFAAHRLAAEAETEARIVAWLRSEAQSCDCFARSEGECACGAWSDYKTMNVEQLADAIARREHAGEG